MLVKSKSFSLFGEKWNIKYVDKIEVDEETYFKFGYTNSVQHVIVIAVLDDNKKPLSQEVLNTTLAHELMHAILDSGQYNQASHDEPMVEWLGRCIISLIKQKIL